MVIKINSDTIIEDICKESSAKEIVIYGAGHYGKIVNQYLETKYNVRVKCFAVSSKEHIIDSNSTNEIYTIDSIAKNYRNSILIIAVSEQKQADLIEMALKYKFTRIYLVLNEFLAYMKSELKVNRLKPLELLNFEVHLTDHCNLNCRGCIHFSPLSEESYLSVEQFERDFEQMYRLCGNKISYIVLLGGEPLLHPQITEFFYIARRYFAGCDLILLTNGILLHKMDENFWKACVENNITLKCTRYPIQIDYDLLKKKANDYNLKIIYQNDPNEGEKMMFKFPFDLQGKQPIQWNYEHCTRSNMCITLKNGRLFTCPLAAHAHLAKDYFGLDMELSSNDSIDIYNAKNFEEITQFLVKPIPFCRYCDVKIKPEQQKWAVSEKSYDEWF